jgi:hypothetical protein
LTSYTISALPVASIRPQSWFKESNLLDGSGVVQDHAATQSNLPKSAHHDQGFAEMPIAHADGS